MNLRTRVIGSLAVVFAVLFGVALVCTRSIRDVVRTQNAVTQAELTRTTVYTVLSRLTEAESGVRGYVLTGDTTYIASATRAQRALVSSESELERLTADNAPRAQPQQLVAPLITRRLAAMEASIRARNAHGMAVASDGLWPGRALTDSLRSALLVVDSQVAAEVGPLAARSDVQEQRAASFVLSGAVVASLAIVMLALLLRRDFKRRKMSEAHYRSVIDVLAEGVFVRDPAGTIVECNPSAERILGLKREEILGMPAGDIACFCEDGTPMPLEARPGIAARASQGAVRSEVMGIRRPDGEMRWLLVNAAPMFVPGSNRLAGVATSFADITRRKEAEAAVREHREQLQDFLDNATDLIVITNADGRLLYTNRACREALGIGDGTEIAGRPMSDFLDAGSRERFGGQTRQLVAGQSLKDVEAVFVGPGGRSVAVAGNVTCRFEHGIPVAFRGIFRDVTEINAAQEQLLLAIEQASEANRAKSEFLANMSHELRTPLNSVIGFASVMMRNRHGTLPPQEIQYLQRIHDNGLHLLSLINSVLDLSKVEAGRMEFELAPLDLDQLIREILAGLEAQVQGRPIELRADVPAGLAPLSTDAGKLKQILLNLIGNALKFTEQGSITVRVRAGPDRRPVALEVVDTGIGIPLDRQATVFEAFRQADNSTARRFGGTGLGLTITRSLCQLMGYRIEIASEPGVGTTFTVAFDADVALTPPAEAPASPGHEPRVLIIDDDPDARILLSQYVRDAGFEAISIGTGEQGLRVAAATQPSLILLDIMMPRMNGHEVLEKLRADPQLAGIPVVIVSIVATEQRRRAIGAAALIDKPVRREEIERVLRNYIAQPPVDKGSQLDALMKQTLTAAV